MRAAALAVLVFATAAHADEHSDLMRELVSLCIKVEAANLDDRVSDASSVASAVLVRCRLQINLSMDAETAGMDAESKRNFIDKVSAALRDIAITGVLQHRRER